MSEFLNPTQIARKNYFKWRERMDQQGIRFFRHKQNGVVLEMLSSSWNGGTGMVNLNEVLKEQEKRWTADYRVCYTRLEPLNAMEVIAACAASEP